MLMSTVLYVSVVLTCVNLTEGFIMRFASGNAYSNGRPKGSQNKVPGDLRDAIYSAFKHKGGMNYLLTLKDKDFVILLKALLPSELKATITHGLVHEDFLLKLAQGLEKKPKTEGDEAMLN